MSDLVGGRTMKVDSVSFGGTVLKVHCSGVFGDGSDGGPSAIRIKDAINAWITANPTEKLTDIEVDFRGVDYFWGDGPHSYLWPFTMKGVRIKYLSRSKNDGALNSLFNALGWYGFKVEKRDSSVQEDLGSPTR